MTFPGEKADIWEPADGGHGLYQVYLDQAFV